MRTLKPGEKREPAPTIYKCTDCWKVYSMAQVSTGNFSGCGCGSVRFVGRQPTLFNRFKLWLGGYL
jgi:DNA-directed RNA polymerase subunit RPC12/RpoP